MRIGPEGVLVGVADKITLKGKSHIYSDRLLVKMENVGSEWQVIELKHLPIDEERSRLQEFLTSAGAKRI